MKKAIFFMILFILSLTSIEALCEECEPIFDRSDFPTEITDVDYDTEFILGEEQVAVFEYNSFSNLEIAMYGSPEDVDCTAPSTQCNVLSLPMGSNTFRSGYSMTFTEGKTVGGQTLDLVFKVTDLEFFEEKPRRKIKITLEKVPMEKLHPEFDEIVTLYPSQELVFGDYRFKYFGWDDYGILYMEYTYQGDNYQIIRDIDDPSERREVSQGKYRDFSKLFCSEEFCLYLIGFFKKVNAEPISDYFAVGDGEISEFVIEEVKVTDECESNEDCDDNDITTQDSCEGRPTKCHNNKITWCYDGDGQCPQGCVYGNDEDCPECTSNTECDDYHPCTTDICSNNTCTHERNPGCRHEGECVPYGKIVGEGYGSKYCSNSSGMVTRRITAEYCEQNYECVSNRCNDNICMSTSTFDNLVLWLLKFFKRF